MTFWLLSKVRSNRFTDDKQRPPKFRLAVAFAPLFPQKVEHIFIKRRLPQKATLLCLLLNNGIDTLNFSFYDIYYSLSKRVSLLCTIYTHIQNHRSFPIHHHKEECDIKVAMRTTLLPIFSKRSSFSIRVYYDRRNKKFYFTYFSSSLYSNISPGWMI